MNYFNSVWFPADLMDDPERYLGPNYKTVINFYELYVEGRLYFPEGYHQATDDNLDYRNRLEHTVLEIIPKNIAHMLHHYSAAYELIAMHLLLDRGETLKFLPLISYKSDEF
jgi:hypothetical protein